MSGSLAIVLVNYRNPEDTVKCLDSLAASPDRDVAVYLVENGSGDDSRAILSAHLLSLPLRSRLIDAGENLGFSGGCNLGASAALADGAAEILLLNNDTTVPPGFIPALRAARADHPGAILTGSMLDPDTGKPGHSIGDISPLSLVVRHRRVLPPGPYRRVGFASGGLMLVPADAWRGLGPLRSDFFMYCEDLDFCLRAADRGIPIVYAAAVSVFHREGSSSRKSRLPRVYYAFRNQTRIVRERGRAHHRIFYLLFLLNRIPGLLLHPSRIGQFLRGIRDGARGRMGRLPG